MSFAKFGFGIFILAIVTSGVIYSRYYADVVKMGTIVGETETQLGFDFYVPPVAERGGSSGYPLGDSALLVSIASRGIFDEAGFEHGDVIPLTQQDFFEYLLLNQGKHVNIPVIREGKNLTISVDIPELDLSYDPCDLKVYECGK